MSRILPLLRLLLVCGLFIASSANAQSTSAESVTKQADPQQVTEVIQLLESETARTEFLKDLKAIHSLQNQTATTTTDENGKLVANKIDLTAESQGIVARYRAMLDVYGLNETWLGQVLLMCLSALVYVSVLIILSRMAHWLEDQITKLQERYHLRRGRIRKYFHALGWIIGTSATCALLFSWAVIWDVADIGNIRTSIAYVVIGKILHILMVIMLGITLWEVLSGVIEFYLLRTNSNNTNRVKTLLPVARSVLFAVVAVLFTLVLLSEMGIDIMPMLAGAGVIGIAVGFGAQTMVKDYISGFTILMEDLIRVGDIAMLGGHAGTVEKITLRKVQLRAEDGTVFTVPYSEITVIGNRTKDFSYYVIEQSISYRQEVNPVIAVMREVDEAMRADKDFKKDMLAPLEIMGVDRVVQTGAVIKARLKTAPGKQWAIGREFNNRLREAIVAHDFETTNTARTIVVNEQAEARPKKKA